jgi:calcineurin-like phosphoesterase family protein
VKILAVTDKVVDSIYSPRLGERFGDIDLVLSCGDLPYSYLEFIVSTLNVPCFYVHGNHDCEEHMSCGLILQAPGGWVNLDRRTVNFRGVLIGGLEGSIRYRPGPPYQYTETEMRARIASMLPALLRNRLRYGRYLDILITHSPPFGIQDGPDRAHRGFKAFLPFMARFRPRLLLHGHQHLYGREEQRAQFLDTEIINVYPYQVIEWQNGNMTNKLRKTS